jgi:hypothetical protein
MADMSDVPTVWVFNGARSNFPSAVFNSRELAEEWISEHNLTGTLTRYPLDEGVYEWAVRRGYFTPKRNDQKTAEFIGRFSSASQEHYHYDYEDKGRGDSRSSGVGEIGERKTS